METPRCDASAVGPSNIQPFTDQTYFLEVGAGACGGEVGVSPDSGMAEDIVASVKDTPSARPDMLLGCAPKLQARNVFETVVKFVFIEAENLLSPQCVRIYGVHCALRANSKSAIVILRKFLMNSIFFFS